MHGRHGAEGHSWVGLPSLKPNRYEAGCDPRRQEEAGEAWKGQKACESLVGHGAWRARLWVVNICHTFFVLSRKKSATTASCGFMENLN